MKRLLSASNLACYIRAAASVCLLLALILGTARIAGAQPLTINVPDLGTYSIGLIEIPLTASGGSGAYTWSIFAGVPPGLVLRSDVPSWFPPDTTEGLIGIATTPRSYTFTLEVSDGATFVDKQVTLNIIGLAVQTPFNLPDAFIGSPYSYQLAVSGSPDPALLTWSLWPLNESMPAGLTLGSDGLLSGTPTVSGSFNAAYSVSDGIDTIHWSHNLGIFPIQITTDGVLPFAIITRATTRRSSPPAVRATSRSVSAADCQTV